MFKAQSGCQRFFNCFVIFSCAVGMLGAGQTYGSERKRQRFELGSTFHPADQLFGDQLQKFLAIVKKNSRGKLKFRRSRKTRGSSAAQTVNLLNAGSIEAVLLDPIGLGFRPAVAQIFGGLPFGPKATEINTWAKSTSGRKTVEQAFQGIGVHPLLCGHSESTSGVFARTEFVWPVPMASLTIHSQGLANDVYKHLKIATRPLHAGDLYMGYASGVVDLLVSLNPSMSARAGFAQVSDYFYYPSWERSSAFALLLIRQQKWQLLSVDNQEVITNACETLNDRPPHVDVAGSIATIARQGAGNTVVKPWPPQFLEAAKLLWKESASRLVNRHDSLGPAFKALKIPTLEP